MANFEKVFLTLLWENRMCCTFPNKTASDPLNKLEPERIFDGLCQLHLSGPQRQGSSGDGIWSEAFICTALLGSQWPISSREPETKSSTCEDCGERTTPNLNSMVGEFINKCDVAVLVVVILSPFVLLTVCCGLKIALFWTSASAKTE